MIRSISGKFHGYSIRPAAFAVPVFLCLGLILAGCNNTLPIKPEESAFSEAGILLSTYTVNFDPTFLGNSNTRQIQVTYGDTLDARVYFFLSDTSVFRFSPDSLMFNKRNRSGTVQVIFSPVDVDSVRHARLYLATATWADSLHVRMDTLGVDSVRLAGAGQDYYLDMQMVFIPGGTFQMGLDSIAVDSIDYQDKDEFPPHPVTVSDFLIGRYEVTNIQYYEFWKEDSANRTPLDTASIGYWPKVALDKPNFPAIGVSWEDANAFCQWLSLRTGERYSLPTEAQWEYAARGGQDRLYPWSAPLGSPADTAALPGAQTVYANVKEGGDGYTFTAPVDAFPDGASAFGPLNMAGNVAEWCYDWYDPDYYSRQQTWVNPQGPSGVEFQFYKVVRGGSWLGTLSQARTTNRRAISPGNREIDVGFRVAKDL